MAAGTLAGISLAVIFSGFTASAETASSGAVPVDGPEARVAAVSPAAAGTAGRVAVSTPGVDLANEVVRITWSGFTPTLGNGLYGVIVMQCKADPTSLADCATADAFPSVADGNRATGVTASDGTGSTQFEIRPAANLPELGCSATNACSVLVYENDGLPFGDAELPGKHAIVPITFARSQADCPPVFDFDVRVDGSASAAPLFYRWAGEMCQGDDAVVLDYTEASSTSGRENFLGGLTDMGVTALPASAEELDAHPDHRDFSYAPVSATAMVVAYNLRDSFTGERLDNVVFSPRLVARLITNTDPDTFFKDRELLRLNPGVRFPSGSAMRPLIRAERSASTTIVTSWLAADANVQSLLAGDDIFRVKVNTAYENYAYPQDMFQNVSGDTSYLPRQGQRNVALRLFYGVSPNGTARENTSYNGVIGIVDLPTARRFGLQVARLARPDNTSVGPTAEALTSGLAAMTTSPEGLLVSNPAPDDPTAYPLVRVEYAMVPSMVSTAEKRDDIRSVLEHAVGDGQEQLPDGYIALPSAMRQQTLQIAARIEAPAAATTTTVAAAATTTTVAVTTTTRPPRTTTSLPSTTTTSTAPTVTTTTTPPTSQPYVPPASYSGGGSTATTPPVAVVTSTTSDAPRRPTTTTSVLAETTTTVVSAITVPAPQLALPTESSARPARVVGGMGGLAAAAMIGTIPPSRFRLPKRNKIGNKRSLRTMFRRTS